METISHTDKTIVRYKKSHKGLKNQAHLYFDLLWQTKQISRDAAYTHMADWFNVTDSEVHMANASKEMCKEIIYRAIQLLNDLRRLDLDFGDAIKTPFYELIEQ